MTQLRKNKFYLGRFHGKTEPDNSKSEAQIQRKVFMRRKLKFIKKSNDIIPIRLFGYEVPIEDKGHSSKRVDFMGYDKKRNLYIIELKRSKSTESMTEIIEQVNEYEVIVRDIKRFIESEFHDEFLYEIKFTNIKKMILAPYYFYKPKKQQLNDLSIYYCRFRTSDIGNEKSQKDVPIHLVH